MGNALYVTCFSVSGGPLTADMHDTLHWDSRLMMTLEVAPGEGWHVEGGDFHGLIIVERPYGRLAGVASPVFTARLRTPHGEVIVRYLVDCSAAADDQELKAVLARVEHRIAAVPVSVATDSAVDEVDLERDVASSVRLVEQAFGFADGDLEEDDPCCWETFPADELAESDAAAAGGAGSAGGSVVDDLLLFLQAKNGQSPLN